MNSLKLYLNHISPLSESTWEEIMPLFTKQILAKNQYFVNTDTIAENFGFLENGVVRAFYINSEGKEYNKQFFVGQTIIGAYSSLLTGKSNLVAQQALTDCTVYSCNYKKLISLYDKFHDLERISRKIAEYYFIEKEKKEIEIVLLDAIERYSIFQQEFPKLDQLIPQYHIASYLGISQTQLSRIRNQIKTKK